MQLEQTDKTNKGKGTSSIVQSVDIGSHTANLDNKGNWTYIEKSLKADTLYGRKEVAAYQDKAEIKSLEQVETQSKNDFKDTLKQTVLEIAVYLKSIMK